MLKKKKRIKMAAFDPAVHQVLSCNCYFGRDELKNSLIIGSVGSGKTFGPLEATLMQANDSYVVVDFAGELYRQFSNYLKERGYDVQRLDFSRFENSKCYNPLFYAKTENDVVEIANQLSMTYSGFSDDSDPFFRTNEKNTLLMLLFYIWSVYDEKSGKRNLSTIVKMIEDEDQLNKLDDMFEDLAKKDPSNPSFPYYVTFKKQSIKTRDATIRSLITKLWTLNTDVVKDVIATNTIQIGGISDKKMAIFVTPPIMHGNDSMTSLFISQAIRIAENESNKDSKQKVLFLLDEYLNSYRLYDSHHDISTCHYVKFMVFVQDLAQIERCDERTLLNLESKVFLSPNCDSSKPFFKEQMLQTIDHGCIVYCVGHQPKADEKIKASMHPNWSEIPSFAL